MSLIRRGSPCSFAGWPWIRWCHDSVDVCPGSSVYVYSHAEDSHGGDLWTCCGCSLDKDDEDVEFDDVALTAHLRQHHEAGDHVPLVLFDEATIAREHAFKMSMTQDEWMDWVLGSISVGWSLMCARQAAWAEALRDPPLRIEEEDGRP